MGDGGFGMTISELSTAVEHGINTITIVMNNKSWGAEKAYPVSYTHLTLPTTPYV